MSDSTSKTFACPACSQHLEAPAELMGMEIDCPACGTTIMTPAPAGVPVSGAPAATAATQPHPPSVAPPAPRPKALLLVIMATVLLSVLATVAGIWLVGKLKTEEEVAAAPQAPEEPDDGASARPEEAANSSEKHKLWRFEYGSSRSDCIEIMKSLKEEGVFEELQTSSVLYGWLPGAECITGRVPHSRATSMGGILTIPADTVQLYFLNDKLAGIEASTFYRHVPSIEAIRQALGLEDYFGSERELRTVEDEVGNRSSFFRLQKGSLIGIVESAETRVLSVRICDSSLIEEE